MEEATFGRLEEIPKGRREFVRILTMVPVGMAINVRFITSAQSVQAVIQGSPAEGKGLLHWLVDPLRSGLLSFEQRGTHACNITFSCKGYICIYIYIYNLSPWIPHGTRYLFSTQLLSVISLVCRWRLSRTLESEARQ